MNGNSSILINNSSNLSYTSNIGIIKKFKPELNKFDNYEIAFKIDKDFADYIANLNLKENEFENNITKYLTILFNYYLYLFYKNIYTMTNKYTAIFSHIIYEHKYTGYELFLTFLFICLVIIMLIIIYWDYVYRSANKLSRCTEIRDIVDTNIENDDPFVYNIIIFDKSDINEKKSIDKIIDNFMNDKIQSIMDKYIIKIKYNFLKQTTDIYKGNTQNVDKTSDETDAFVYFELNNSYINKKPIELEDALYLEKNDITSDKYIYVATTSTYKVLNDDASLKLAEFVKHYGKDSFNTNIYPIYSIINAVEQNNIINNR